MYSPETVARIEELRQYARSRKLTDEELTEATKLIRQERVGASYASAGSKARKASAAVKPDGESILAGLLKGLS